MSFLPFQLYNPWLLVDFVLILVNVASGDVAWTESARNFDVIAFVPVVLPKIVVASSHNYKVLFQITSILHPIFK